MDIYSLGIMFYEMCFPFRTNMERIYVIQNLRQKEIILSDEINQELFETQVNFCVNFNNKIKMQNKLNQNLVFFLFSYILSSLCSITIQVC